MTYLEVLQRPIILGSQSPRRHQLLTAAGFTNIQVHPLDVDESFPADLAVELVAPYLAEKKAAAGQSLLTNPAAVLLTADSVVILHQQIYNKPADAAEARAMLNALSGQRHQVVTGVSLLSQTKQQVFAESAYVQFGVLTPAEIDYYIHTYQPFDKAGSYAIQEWIGLCKIAQIEGTFANIMGLPVNRVYAELLTF